MVISCGGRVLADKVEAADTFLKRFRGLMGRKSLADGEGLLLLNCSSIHCFFMKIAIDAVYLSEDMTVLGKETLAPWKIGGRFQKTAHVLELAAGAADVAVGQSLNQYAQEGGTCNG